MIYLEDIIRNSHIHLTQISNNIDFSRRIASVTVLENPDVGNWIHGGEVLLTTSKTLGSSENAVRLITTLSALKVACLIIKPSENTSQIPQNLIRKADSLGFPVFGIDRHTDYLQIMNFVNEMLFEDHKVSQLINLDLNYILRTSKISQTDLDYISSAVGQDLYKQSVIVWHVAFKNSKSLPNKLTVLENFISRINLTLRSCDKISVFNVKETDGLTVVLFNNKISMQFNTMLEKRLLRELKTLGSELYIGISNVHPANGANRAYQESIFATKMAKVFLRTNSPTFFRNMKLWHTIQEIDYGSRMSENTQLEMLLDEKNYFNTLKIYFETNESVKKTAEKMFAHQNTIRYRLNTIKERTGLDYQKTNDKLTLYVSIMSRLLN